jgi:hypothetical protein
MHCIFFLLLQLAGDGFSDAADIRRRALDLVFLSYMREQSEHRQQQQRDKQLAAAGPAVGNAAAAGATGGSTTGSNRPGSPSKAARLLQRRAAGIAGPDVSSWEGLWCSLTAMSGRRMLPLLQVGWQRCSDSAQFHDQAVVRCVHASSLQPCHSDV